MRPGIILLALGGVVAIAGGWMALVHYPNHAASQAATAQAGASVSAGGITLASQSILLPEEKSAFPAGAAGELLSLHCTACHSAQFVMAQPVLGAEKWHAEVKKMRAVYKAEIPAADEDRIVAALVSREASQRVGTGSSPE